MSADYGADINVQEYKYIQSVLVTEAEGKDHTHYTARLDLDSTKFNFTLANALGLDVHFSEATNGTNMLRHWKAYWCNVDDDKATVFIKIPNMLANETRRIHVIWGGTLDDRSDPDTVGLLLADAFSSFTASNAKWVNNFSMSTTHFNNDYGLYIPTNGYYIKPVSDVLAGKVSWVIESFAYWDDSQESNRIVFTGTENALDIRYYPGSTIYHNIVNGGGYVSNSYTYGGGQRASFNETHTSYYEPTDKIRMRQTGRSSYPDADYYVERSVYGDTRQTSFYFYGPYNNNTTQYFYVAWVLVREYRLDEAEIDYTDLFVQYENVVHQEEDTIEYGPDVTNEELFHYTTYSGGGNPFKLSNNDAQDVWETDQSTAQMVDGVGVIVDFSCDKEDVTAETYIHYDSGHEKFYAAAKLSDNGTDPHGRDTWRTQSPSGWASIDFNTDAQAISGLSVRTATSIPPTTYVTFSFSGAFDRPTLSGTDWFPLASGTLVPTNTDQFVHFYNETPFRHYKLYCQDDADSQDIELEEWGMYRYKSYHQPRNIVQVRLLPDFENNQQKYFPRYFSLQGSNEGQYWEELHAEYTYTPFYEYTHGRWHRYTTLNEKPFYVYRMVFKGNWNGDTGKMVVADWEMVELASEEYTYRIFNGTDLDEAGTTAVWALPNAGIDGLFYSAIGGNLNKVNNSLLVSDNRLANEIIDINVIQ
ncbi:hypothetical protein DRQ25_09035 [Candidatus Fermentibacteria bacterium]|nr:MAG: hypothetical protein DRQ25_09035 [Candidatus Fermentibacteria bacterium]